MNPHPPTLIVNARLVNEDREFDGDLRFADGRITAIGSGLAAHAGEVVIDAAGRRLLPGMIDDQVHFREPGLEHKGDLATESAAGVGGSLRPSTATWTSALARALGVRMSAACQRPRSSGAGFSTKAMGIEKRSSSITVTRCAAL